MPDVRGVRPLSLERGGGDCRRRGVSRALRAASMPISDRTVGRILAHAALQPHRQRMWTSHDEDFRQKRDDVLHVYYDTPPDEHVICVDEKTGMQALERRYPDLPMTPGSPVRREFEYVRHGTLSLMGAFDVRLGFATERHNADEFITLLDAIDACYPDTGRRRVVRRAPSLDAALHAQACVVAQPDRVRVLDRRAAREDLRLHALAERSRTPRLRGCATRSPKRGRRTMRRPRPTPGWSCSAPHALKLHEHRARTPQQLEETLGLLGLGEPEGRDRLDATRGLARFGARARGNPRASFSPATRASSNTRCTSRRE
jgi:hypothetical protein